MNETAESAPGLAYHADFLGAEVADRLLSWCLSSAVCWRQEQFRIFGRCHEVPRRLCWFGSQGVNYRYAGLDHPATGWPDELQDLRIRMETAAGRDFNFVLLNRYDSGSHHMGWHRDDERGTESMIASVSLGAARRFRYRDDTSVSHALSLAHGSLLLFDGTMQHMLARTRKAVGTRVNLTFRTLQAGTSRA